jgi:hypothetical protein
MGRLVKLRKVGVWVLKKMYYFRKSLVVKTFGDSSILKVCGKR